MVSSETNGILLQHKSLKSGPRVVCLKKKKKRKFPWQKAGIDPQQQNSAALVQTETKWGHEEREGDREESGAVRGGGDGGGRKKKNHKKL